MRSVAAAALLLLATAASGGELIRFRAPDGRVGMVDHPSKLPPGAVVVERREQTERAPEPAAVPAEEPRGAPARAQRGDDLPPGLPARPGDSADCLRLGLAAGCDAGEIKIAELWCERARDARTRVEQAEQALEAAEEDLDDCETASLRGGYCSRRRFEAAELELESAESDLDGLEDACRDAGCLPGWMRGDCR